MQPAIARPRISTTSSAVVIFGVKTRHFFASRGLLRHRRLQSCVACTLRLALFSFFAALLLLQTVNPFYVATWSTVVSCRSVACVWSRTRCSLCGSDGVTPHQHNSNIQNSTARVRFVLSQLSPTSCCGIWKQLLPQECFETSMQPMQRRDTRPPKFVVLKLIFHSLYLVCISVFAVVLPFLFAVDVFRRIFQRSCV